MYLLTAGAHPRRRAVAAAAGVLLATGPAAAGGRIAVDPSTVRPDGTVVISGTVPTTGSASCPARDSAVLTSAAALFPPYGSGPQASRAASGAFRVSYRVPGATAAGTYRVGVRCAGRNVGVQTHLRVTALIRHVPASAAQARPGVARGTSGVGRWLIGMGTLLMAIGIYLAVAELAPWRGRRG